MEIILCLSTLETYNFVGFDGGNGQMRKHFIHFRLDKYNKSHKNKSNILAYSYVI